MRNQLTFSGCSTGLLTVGAVLSVWALHDIEKIKQEAANAHESNALRTYRSMNGQIVDDILASVNAIDKSPCQANLEAEKVKQGPTDDGYFICRFPASEAAPAQVRKEFHWDNEGQTTGTSTSTFASVDYPQGGFSVRSIDYQKERPPEYVVTSGFTVTYFDPVYVPPIKVVDFSNVRTYGVPSRTYGNTLLPEDDILSKALESLHIPN